MEIGIAILLFVCMTALLYVILSLKITRQVDLQIKEFYKTRVHADMQEFYREMEGYAALFENRIQRFRVLVERNETVLRDADSAQAPITNEVISTREREAKNSAPIKIDIQKPKRLTAKQKLAAKKMAKAKALADKKEAVAAKAVQKTAPIAKSVPQVSAAPHIEVKPPMVETYRDDEDSAIAEELMKDLFLKDEIELSERSVTPQIKATASATAKRETAAPDTVSQSSPQVANFFSRLGRAIEPVLFGQKSPAAATVGQPEIVRLAPPAASAAPAQQKAASDFSEVLRRAEQIKAEKQAERERAEVEAKAEFYAAGDSFQNQRVPEARLRAGIQAENIAARIPEVPALMPAAEPRRNTLVVKELDNHTVNFLIDSLVKDNGYRKQALRALTENNIPLAEIARLSKIDIGELELMRQLGRF